MSLQYKLEKHIRREWTGGSNIPISKITGPADVHTFSFSGSSWSIFQN